MRSSLEQEIRFLKSLKYDSKIVLQPKRIRLYDFILGDASSENIARFPTGRNLAYPVMLRNAVWALSYEDGEAHLVDRYTLTGCTASCGCTGMPAWSEPDYLRLIQRGICCTACLAFSIVAMLPGQRIINRVEAP